MKMKISNLQASEDVTVRKPDKTKKERSITHLTLIIN